MDRPIKPDRDLKTRKDHRCWSCSRLIRKGEFALRRTSRDEKYVDGTRRVHVLRTAYICFPCNDR